MISRLLPLVGVLLFVGIVFGWRPWLQRRRHGTWGVVLFRSKRPGDNLRDGMGVLLFALLVGQAVIWAGWPELLPRFIAMPGGLPAWRAAGAALLFAGIGFLIAGQLQLGASWRIGIEEAARPGLVTNGLYRFCRNPIFLALLVIVAGYALLLPTRLSMILLLGTYIGVRQQASAEEAYLLRAYAERYREYARRVGRFVPGLGRLR